MSWKGIVGQLFTPDTFTNYVATSAFGVWRPRFVVVHNTSAPDLKTWKSWQLRSPPFRDEQWARNLESYYKGLGWSGCPHIFVTPAGMLAMNPLNMPGTHSPAWNSISWGVETVGEFERESFTGAIRDNLVACLAILHAAAGLQLTPYERGVRGLHFHKEDPKTTHKSCPGRNMVKADLIAAVQAEIERRHGGEHAADEGGTFGTVNTAPDDPLNLRAAPTAKARIIAGLLNGSRLIILGGQDAAGVRWLNVSQGQNTGWVRAKFVEAA